MYGYIFETCAGVKNSCNLLKIKQYGRLKKVHVWVHIPGMKISFKKFSNDFR